MHAAAWRALRAAHKFHRRPACRTVAGVRHPFARGFHPSTAALRAPEDPAGAAASEKKDDNNKQEEIKGQDGLEGQVADGAENTTQSNDATQRSGRRHGYGSGIRRASRRKATTGLPSLALPEWFWGKNITCFGEPEDLTRWVDVGRPIESAEMYELIENNGRPLSSAANDLATEDALAIARAMKRLVIKRIEWGIHAAETLRKEVESLLEDLEETKGKAQELESTTEREDSYADQPFEMSWNEKGLERAILLRRYAVPMNRLSAISKSRELSLSKPRYWYSIHKNVYAEIYASLCGELRLPSPKVNIKDMNRQDTVLMCPVNGGLRYLDAVVQSVATVLETDVIRLDAEDIAQIVGGYLGENVAWTQSPLALLGYEQSHQSESSGTQNPADDDEDANGSDENDDINPSAFPPESAAGPRGLPMHASIAFLQTPAKLFQGQNLSKIMNLGNFLGQSASSGPFAAQSANPGESWNDYKIGRAMDAIIAAADVKRARTVVDTAEDQQLRKDSTLPASKGLILQISGYNELNDHPVGYNILKSLREAVKRRWYEGSSVIIVGTTAKSAEEKSVQLPIAISNRFSSDFTFDRPRTIYVPPGHHPERIHDDQKADIRDLNIRHVEHMIRKLLGPEHESQWTINLSRDLWIDTKSEVYSGLWGYDWVRKLAINMLGIAGSDRLLDGSTLEHALHMLRLSDRRKVNWTKQGVTWAKQEHLSRASAKGISNAGEAGEKYPTVEEAAVKKDDWLDKLKVKCTAYEKKLLGGVINPSDIHTTFADVRAPLETVEALKTLTSLSLIRPDSFSYGVLASDRIPGVLLYGPPGTGKTLLAKAVAKESGATMLEVSASEINDMYVGEGEKNVKALFSLAKKLAPCVVFIDEADSLLGSRGSSFQRKSHREIINQFLREWDGMANLSAFIMVATNRPFDLDEAVLRRLPRRLLVDLPVEKDREAILQIHLKDEILDESISLAELAKHTPFYSGSDLKNLSVAAALACVREENDVAAKYTGEEPYVYPPKRILRKEHFDKAMEEISASISEDMSTLRAIRKFDERYGDRKGRPKKKPSMGFGGTTDSEPDSEAGRVRKLELNV
jgi:hypothetical protein